MSKAQGSSDNQAIVSNDKMNEPSQATTNLLKERKDATVPSPDGQHDEERTIASSGSPIHHGPTLEKDKGGDEQWVVRWEANDPGNPVNAPTWKKWAMVITLATSCGCVTACSSMAALTFVGMDRDFHIGVEVSNLSVSLYIFGLAVGPLVLAPASEFIGRGRVMHLSFIAFFLLQFPVAFANNPAVYFIFRFLDGFAGSAFLSVSSGAITDVFENHQVGTPMMIFSASPFLGPIIGPLVAGFINEDPSRWRWTWYTEIIWSAVQLGALLLLVHETLAPELLRRRAVQLRKQGESRWIAPVEKLDRSFLQTLNKSVRTPFILLSTEYMCLLLNLWTALLLGILYLFFGGIPYVFATQYGFNTQDQGMAFLGIGVGQVIACACQRHFNAKYRAIAMSSPGGKAPPEARLISGYYGAVLAPLGLFLFGLTSFRRVHWIVPIIMSAFYGAGMIFAFTAVFTYLVDAYRPVAASALASNALVRCTLAGAFPLFGDFMYRRMGAVGGTCFLAGVTCLAVPLPFVFHRIGPRIREKSRFGAADSK